MTFSEYKDSFNTLLGVKQIPNHHEKMLFERAQKYIRRLTWIPGIEMIAIANSLSMYATHSDSDIDLFVITSPQRIWLVRFLMTSQFFLQKVWRKGDAIRGNFCLSFFITTEAMDLRKIAISNDIYLYYWIYSLKPILTRGTIYDQFLKANNWVILDAEQRIINAEFQMQDTNPGASNYPLSTLYSLLNTGIRFFLFPYTRSTHLRMGSPYEVVISDSMLKFHDQDSRENIRDAILEKDFDK